jgi:branched-chain amino acid aminotransferase
MPARTIDITLTDNPKVRPDEKGLGFGRYFTDHMFLMDYSDETGWYDPRIVPYGPLAMDPASAVIHYGQSTFEGLKAYQTADKRVFLFRPKDNLARLNRSNDRVCIPELDIDFALEAMKTLIRVDRAWVPSVPGTSLYIRPVTFGTEPMFGVRSSKSYLFAILLSPVGSYYPQGVHPVRIFVEQEYVRSVRGGTGYAKTAGNYAAGLRAQKNAQKYACVQVLWLDGIERKYIEEVGAMNVFFKIRGTVVTPPLGGTILGGITRDSVIQLLKHWGIPVEERRLAMEEVDEAHRKGELEEAFGTGTAAVISPIGELVRSSQTMTINKNEIGPLSQKLYDTLTGIQKGTVPDTFGWMEPVSEMIDSRVKELTH